MTRNKLNTPDELADLLIQCNMDILDALEVEDYEEAHTVHTFLQLLCQGQAELLSPVNGLSVNENLLALLQRSDYVFQQLKLEKAKYVDR